MADADGITDIVDKSGNGKGVALNVYPYYGTPVVYSNLAAFPAIGLVRNTYVAEDTERQYRWDPITLAYVEISPTDPTIVNTIFVSSRAALAALNPIAFPKVFFDGSLWEFSSSDLSTFVTVDTTKGLYIAPNSAATGASGAWVRNFVGYVNPLWFGILDGDVAGANGAANDIAWDAMLNTLKLRGDDVGSTRKAVEPIQFPKGWFEFATTREFKNATLIVEGVDGWMAGSYSTRFKFPAGQTGIRVQAHNTSGSGGGPVAAERSGAGLILRNIAIVGGFTTTEGEFHGIQLRAQAHIENVKIDGFEGDGLYAVADLGGATEGNVNLSTLHNINVVNCRNGFFFDGADANVIVIINCDASSNRQWGYNDSGFLGNTYVGCHSASNGFTIGTSPSSTVSHGGNRYAVIAGQEAGASTNAPTGAATDNTWWFYISAGGVGATFPAWSSGATYRAGGAYRTDNNNARHVLAGCYAESGQGPAQIVRPTQIIGGHQSAAVIGTGAYQRMAAIAGAFEADAYRASYRNATFSAQLGEQGVPTALQLTDSVVGASSWRLRLNGNELQFDYANLNANRAYAITGPSTALNFGKSAALPHALVATRLIIGTSGGSLDNNGREVFNGTAAPSSGAHAAGEWQFNRAPAVRGVWAWTCRTAGTPGTWEPVGIVGAVVAAAQADSVAGDVATLVTDFNSLLAKLRTANLLAP